MEFCGGGNLDAQIAQHNGLDEAVALEYFTQIANALTYMHSQQVIHLDLKPSNIMLRTNEQIVLIDFGLSKHYDTNGNPESSTTIGGGTPGYSPIEQANYKSGDKLAVTLYVYALGATLYKMLTGKRPPVATDIFNEGFPTEELQNKGISERTIACIEKAMASAKRSRYQSVEEFLLAITSKDSATVEEPKSEQSVPERTELDLTADNHSVTDSEKTNLIQPNEESVTPEAEKTTQCDSESAETAKAVSAIPTTPQKAPETPPKKVPENTPKKASKNTSKKLRNLHWYWYGAWTIIALTLLLRLAIFLWQHDYYQSIPKKVEVQQSSNSNQTSTPKNTTNTKNAVATKSSSTNHSTKPAATQNKTTSTVAQETKAAPIQEKPDPVATPKKEPKVSNTNNSSSATTKSSAPSVSKSNYTESAVSGLAMKMIFVEGGTFQMGATGQDAMQDESPIHSVTLDSFYIAECEVTQSQWRKIMYSNPSKHKGDLSPVEMVSWHEASEFCRKLSAITRKQYRLPTEAEWEYAARGGKKMANTKYSGSDIIDAVAWYDLNSARTTHPVKQKRANALGLYDMSGNVWEWCNDWYHHYYSSDTTNPKGASNGTSKVLRGGCWGDYNGYCRITKRYCYSPNGRGSNFGFRVVCECN